MIVDASALCAIALQEVDSALFVRALENADRPAMTAVNLFEARLVARRHSADAELADVLQAARIRIVACDAALTEHALNAYARYGKGNHRARLNLGDCYAYALSKSTARPLLYKGADFALTDVVSALSF